MKRKQGGEGSPSPFEDLAVHLDRAVDVQHDVQPDLGEQGSRNSPQRPRTYQCYSQIQTSRS